MGVGGGTSAGAAWRRAPRKAASLWAGPAAAILAAIGAALAVGCATTAAPEMSVVPPFWGSSGRSIRIVVAAPPAAGLWRYGGDWFYHGVVSDARDRSLIGFLATQKFSFAETQRQLEALLASRGFVIVPASAQDADYEITLSVPAWGVTQDYTGVIPKGTKWACVDLHGDLVDLHTGWVLWSHVASGSASLGLQWKEPPEFPRVRAAFASASAAASRELVGALAAWSGTSVVVQ
jgi:hypothetical protein